MPQVLDIEQAVLLLEIEPPFDKRDVQLARRRLAKRWHPDIAPPGRQLEHERHLKAINEAADQLEQLAEDSRGGRVTQNAVKVSAAAARSAAPRRARARTRRSSAARAETPTARSTTRSPRACPTTRSSTATRAASPIPSGASAASTGIYFTGDGDDVQQWARVAFHVGIRTVPAGRCSSSTSRSPTRRRARAALHDRRPARARRGRLPARGAAPRLRARRRARQHAVLRLMTLAFWQAGDSAPRPRRARLDPRRARPAGAAPLRRADLRGHGRAVAGGRGRRARDRARPRPTPPRGSAWGGCGCAASTARARARRSSARARSGRREQGLLDLALVGQPARRRRRRGHRVRAGDAARRGLRGRVGALRARAGAHRSRVGLPRGVRAALALADDPEVRELRDQVARMVPRELRAANRRRAAEMVLSVRAGVDRRARRAGARDLGAGRSRRALLRGFLSGPRSARPRSCAWRASP